MRSFCVCVCVREREREGGGGHTAAQCVCVCVCEREREREWSCVQTQDHHCVCHATLFLSQAWTDGKTKDIINCLYSYFES